MRLKIAIAGVLTALSVACNRGTSSSPSASDNFPVAGTYHVTHEVDQDNSTHSDEFDTDIDVSTREKLEAAVGQEKGSHCHDKHVEIGEGQFTVRMLCDAPDGDIHNIVTDRHGSFSRDSIEITEDTTLWGISSRESYSYRLKGR
ncbi:hypothetical protein ABDK56_12035 [Sphingomonas sp. ASV193]|uniref:hypothetical protein n=1 Tax=Sphingomonas sp. ASV193 TaxID=3144405 RepID=UPI0032E87A62